MKDNYFCPRCGKLQEMENTSFCSGCGLSMIGICETVENGGLPQTIQKFAAPNAESPQRTGLKQGGLLLLSGLFLAPLVLIFSISLNLGPSLFLLTSVVTFWGGILRMLYALIFQSSVPTVERTGWVETLKNSLHRSNKENQSPEISESIEYLPADWRGTEKLDHYGTAGEARKF